MGPVRLLLLTTLVSCVTATPRTRATTLLAESETCESFTGFDTKLASERKNVEQLAGADVVPVSQTLSTARRRCARAVIDRLFELQERRGRGTAVAELEAIARELGAEETTGLVRARWQHEADGFLGDILLSGTPAPVTPAQSPPATPVDPEPERPSFPDAALGDAAECLRRRDLEAASCLREWRRDGGEAKAFDDAVKTLAQRAVRGAGSLPADERLAALGGVLRALAVPSHAEPVKPLTAALLSLSEQTLAEAEALSKREAVEAAAVKARPLLTVGPVRTKAERFTAPATRKHQELALAADGRPHAALFHRTLAQWFSGSDEPMPKLEPGRWDDTRFDCVWRRPVWPPLMPGVNARVTGRCRKTTPAAQQGQDPSMRTFELEASLPRLRVDVDIAFSSAPGAVTKRLTADEVFLEELEAPDSSRPHVLDGPLQRAVAEVEAAHRAGLESEVRRACAELTKSPGTAEDRLVLLARQTGKWPTCFTSWLRATVSVSPPALGTP